jgi:hypothetical protein
MVVAETHLLPPEKCTVRWAVLSSTMIICPGYHEFVLSRARTSCPTCHCGVGGIVASFALCGREEVGADERRREQFFTVIYDSPRTYRRCFDFRSLSLRGSEEKGEGDGKR